MGYGNQVVIRTVDEQERRVGHLVDAGFWGYIIGVHTENGGSKGRCGFGDELSNLWTEDHFEVLCDGFIEACKWAVCDHSGDIRVISCDH